MLPTIRNVRNERYAHADRKNAKHRVSLKKKEANKQGLTKLALISLILSESAQFQTDGDGTRNI